MYKQLNLYKQFNHVPLEKFIPRIEQINENGSRKYLTPQGVSYPSITTVLSEYNKDAIIAWRNRVGAEEANKISNKAATRGTRMHKLAERYLNNEDANEFEFKSLLEQSQFNEFVPVLNRIDNIYGQEMRMYSNYLRIAGTVDCIAEFDGKLSVIDFKTASRPKDKSYIQNYFMQCASYAIMFEELHNIPVSNIVVAISVDGDDPQVFVEKRNNFVDELIYYRDLYEQKQKFKETL